MPRNRHGSKKMDISILSDSEGSLLQDFRYYIDRGFSLAVMPIARVFVDCSPCRYPNGVTFYSPGSANLDELNIIRNSKESKSLAERTSALSGIDKDILNAHPLVVFPCKLNWREFKSGDFRSHMEFIRTLSDYVDKSCLNFIRYRQCPVDIVDALPGNAGTVNSNHMMAGSLLYSPSSTFGYIIGGDAFTHFITRGLGLPIEPIDHDQFPKKGEVGNIVNHALSLYKLFLESSSPTARFVQAMSLLEFLAFPDEFKKFEEVKKVIARYVAKNSSEYQQLLNRFYELTGKADKTVGQITGYRTRIVHMGDRLEDILPDDKERRKLFLELGGYIKGVINHMIQHSEMDYQNYLSMRDANLRPFEK